MVVRASRTKTDVPGGAGSCPPSVAARLPRAACRPRGSSFTLVELLTVMAVLAVLAALILGALGAAREKGEQTACLNHIGQLSMAAQMYADTNGNVYARGHYTDPRYRGLCLWPADIVPYLSHVDLTKCPVGEGDRKRWRDCDGTLYEFDYSFNFFTRVWPDPPPVTLPELKHPEGTIEFCDGLPACIHIVAETDLVPPPLPYWPKIKFRHRGMANLVYFDGHTGAVRASRLEQWTFEKD